MCGICGTLAWDTPDLGQTLRAMTDSLAHRGPDQAGHWQQTPVGLGFRRLAIVDLSPAGHQPMSNEDGTLWLVFNGEIYNAPALRHRLQQLGHTFRSRTDTECILHGYESWGTAVVSQLRGMFAFALYDTRDKTLWLARDRVGIKPLYYYWDGQHFAFASEIKALRTLPNADLTTDPTAIWDYLTYLYIPTPKTIHRSIRQLPAAHTLLLAPGQAPQVQPYWDLSDWQTDPRQPLTPQHQSALAEKLQEVVACHLLADVPLGSLLSGGVDSSLMTALASQANPSPLHTFSIGFEPAEHSELPYARQVAARYQCHAHEAIVTPADLPQQLTKMLTLYDQPFADASGIPTLAVSQLAATQVKVVLSGDGGDEIFGGYKWYRWWQELQSATRLPRWAYRLLADTLRPWAGLGRMSGVLARTRAEILAASGADRYGEMHARVKRWQKPLLLPDLASQFRGYDDHWHYRAHWRSDLDDWSRLQYLDIKTYLPDDILTKVDRASMAVSLEVRPPLLDHELLEMVAQMPLAARQQKHSLRAVARQWLPPEILDRPKQGFSVPLLAWQKAQTIRGARLGGLGLWAWQLLAQYRLSSMPATR